MPNVYQTYTETQNLHVLAEKHANQVPGLMTTFPASNADSIVMQCAEEDNTDMVELTDDY